MKNFLLISFFSFLFSQGFSQIVNTCDSTTIAPEGTFEIVNKIQTEALSTPKQVLTLETLCLIEKSRLESENVILNFENFSIVVYARNKKNKK